MKTIKGALVRIDFGEFAGNKCSFNKIVNEDTSTVFIKANKESVSNKSVIFYNEAAGNIFNENLRKLKRGEALDEG